MSRFRFSLASIEHVMSTSGSVRTRTFALRMLTHGGLDSRVKRGGANDLQPHVTLHPTVTSPLTSRRAKYDLREG